ncbi:MAG: DDE-type integrase/transposase/recombinase, partial [Rubrobacter sp.]|nr:DDE-type integrase/transposase/recombinase [Rubrobacter sp.]
MIRLAEENPTWGLPADPGRAQGTRGRDRAKHGVVYALFFIEIASRKVHLAGITSTPDASWVTQQARSFVAHWETFPFRFLIGDRDAKYVSGFDDVFRSEGLRIIRTPIQAPRANAFAERFVGTLRRECLD